MRRVPRFALASTVLVAVVLAFGARAPSPTKAHAAPNDRSGAAPHQPLSVRWLPDPADTNMVAVEVSGLSLTALQKLQAADWSPGQWQKLLSVYAGQEDLKADLGLPSMLGAYRVESGVLRFEPQFPLDPGIQYRAVLRPGLLADQGDPGGEVISAVFQAPGRSSNPTTVVSHVYPSAGVLPENLLKFYIHFSAPMSRGHIYDYIHLRDDTGEMVELPFLEIGEELWDPAMTRLTLFIDPGRIKRGVRPLEEVGPALEAGKRYTLVIDRGWQDATGNPLKQSFEKTFQAGPPDRDPLDSTRWKIQPPKSGTREPLTITFPKPMDHALAQRVIQVVAGSGELVSGGIALADQERRWTFVPARAWRRGSHKLIVQTTLEDLAGNNIGKPFEVDLFEGVQRQLATSIVQLPFEVR